MKISVIIPCHNAAPYLAQTIGSVLEQSRAPDEILVVDDASTDGSPEIVRGFGDRVRLIPARFGSASRTRNHGFTYAGGDAVMFLDADDVLGPEALEAMEEALQRTPAGIALCPWYRLDLEDGRWIRRPPSGPSRVPGQDRLGAWLMGRYHPPCAVLWSRDAYLRIGGWDELALVNNDGDIMMRAMIQGVPFIETARGSAFYRRLPAGETSLSGRRLTREGIRGGLGVLFKIAGMLEERGDLSRYRQALGAAFSRIAADCGEDALDLRRRAEEGRRRYGEPRGLAVARAKTRSWATRVRRGVGRRVARWRGSSSGDERRLPREAEEIRFGLEARDVNGQGSPAPSVAESASAPGTRTPPGSDGEANPGIPERTGPLVSVVVPTYNRATLVCRAVRSVLAQTFPDYEVLVVDDGSTDETEEAVRSIPDPRVHYLRQSRNRGVSAARNRGIRAARGEFIAFLDSDDEWLPEKLERQVRVLQEAPEEVGLVYSGVRSVDGSGSGWTFRPRHRGDVYGEILEANPIHSGSSVMVRRNVVRTAGFFDEGIPAIEDFDYWIRIARFYRFEAVDEPLVRYHDVDGLDRKSLSTEDNLAAREWLFRKHRREMGRAGVAHRFLMKSSERHLKRWDGGCDGWKARMLAIRAVWWGPAEPDAHRFLLRMLLPKRFQKVPGRMKRWTQRRLEKVVFGG
jgi:O-antigen biosynthesis protein